MNLILAMRGKVEVRVHSPSEMEAKETTHLLHRARTSSEFTDDFNHAHHHHHRGKKEVAVEDLYPTPPSRQTWTARDFGAIWVRPLR